MIAEGSTIPNLIFYGGRPESMQSCKGGVGGPVPVLEDTCAAKTRESPFGIWLAGLVSSLRGALLECYTRTDRSLARGGVLEPLALCQKYQDKLLKISLGSYSFDPPTKPFVDKFATDKRVTLLGRCPVA